MIEATKEAGRTILRCLCCFRFRNAWHQGRFLAIAKQVFTPPVGGYAAAREVPIHSETAGKRYLQSSGSRVIKTLLSRFRVAGRPMSHLPQNVARWLF